jgi:gamma-glutamylputrescine oxidase
MKKTIFPQDQTFWYLKRPDAQSLRSSIDADVAIIGGGMAGLTAAQAFAKKGKKVVLLEAYYCGAGASGKSSGFITPNCEISLCEFIGRYGKDGGNAIWKSIESGVEHIRQNILKYTLDCDYIPEDTLVVASSEKGLKELLDEYNSLAQLGYTTSYITKENLSLLLGSYGYYGGVTYAGSFGISAYKYCQEMKRVLTADGVLIYEETPALYFTEHQVNTLHATVQAEHIIVCADRFIPTFGKLEKEIYHAQNFLLISQPLTENEVRTIFPDKNWMVWDTELIYNYYRMTKNRLLVGGGSLLSTYDRYENHHSTYMYNKLTNYFKSKFPDLTIQFEHMWPGLIGISKDVAPIAGRDKDMPSVYYIAAAAGLPVAAALANYAADYLIDGNDYLKDYFSPYRSFPIGGIAQSILGTRISFAISNFIKKNVP